MPHPDIKMSFLDKKRRRVPYHDIIMLYPHIKMLDRDIIMPHPSVMRPNCVIKLPCRLLIL